MQDSSGSQHARFLRLFSAFLRELIPVHPGVLLNCPELEPYCVSQLHSGEGVALFRFLKQQQQLYL